MHVFSSGGACARPSFPCEMVASRNAFSPRSGSKPCLPDAVLPDVTRHGNFISAPLDRCHPPSLLPEEKMPNFVRRMPCCLTSRAMAISFLHRSTGAAPKPSPRGEGAELCSPDAVEASRLPPVPSGACLTSSLVCFCITCQAFFLSAEKPVSAPGAAPASRTNGRHGAPGHKPTPSHTRQPPRTGPIPRNGRFSTEFSTFLPVFHSGFLSPWLSWRETASDLLSRGFFLQRKTRYGTVLYGTVRYGAA